jgi:hypothetical protein
VVELVGPDGVVQPAQSINTDRLAPSTSYGGWGGPSVGFGVGGGSGGWGSGFGTGIGLSFPLGGVGSSTVESGTIGQVISNAFIPLPDPVLYRQTWQSWRVRVQLGDAPGDVRNLEIAAPAPPA